MAKVCFLDHLGAGYRMALLPGRNSHQKKSFTVYQKIYRYQNFRPTKPVSLVYQNGGGYQEVGVYEIGTPDP